mgnify:FL=1
MTPADLNTLARDIAEAAAKCVGAERALSSAAVGGDSATATAAVVARAGNWRADYIGPVGKRGADEAALNSAAVLALRDRVVAQREERARMLAADDAALRVIDETARVYDAETVAEAVKATGRELTHEGAYPLLAATLDALGEDDAPWTRAQVDEWDSGIADACDAILRRRAGTP